MADAWLVVRAVVRDPADRALFDQWYHAEHLPDAMKAFTANAAWRGWSKSDPSVHYAHYRFESLERLEEVTAGTAINELIAEFDRVWGNRVTRTREILTVADHLEGN